MVSFQWGVFENSIFSLLQDDYIWIRIIYGRCQVTIWIWRMVGQFLVIIPPSFDMQNHNLWGRSSILVGRNRCYTFSVEPYKYIQIQHPPQKKTCIQCVEFHRRSWSGSVVGNTKEIAERFHTSPPQFASKMRCNVLVDYVPGFFQKSIVTPMSGTTQS